MYAFLESDYRSAYYQYPAHYQYFFNSFTHFNATQKIEIVHFCTDRISNMIDVIGCMLISAFFSKQ